VQDLADELRSTGARLFFHVQDEGAAAPTQQEADDNPSSEDEATSEPEIPPAGKTGQDAPPEAGDADAGEAGEDDTNEAKADPGVEACPPDDRPMSSEPDVEDEFAARFERFLDGELENDEIINLVTDALDGGHYQEARELLHFTPRNDNEELARKRHLADYYLAVDQPATALDIIQSLQIDSLPEDDRRDLLMKQASCYNGLNDLENARVIYKAVAKQFPSDQIDALKKRTDERIKQHKRGDALVLEKTTSLNDD
jgi:hypothetical protein